MYLSHYYLKIKPFSISPDSRFLWLGEKHLEALATLKYGIQTNIGFLLLTGDIGTGKTALINSLKREKDLSALVATIPDPGLKTIDFFNFLAFEFNINRKFNSKGSFLMSFRKFLKNAYTSGQKVLIIIDEAQRLSPELLEEIRQLSNIELDHIKLVSIFFVGQSEFNSFLMRDVNKPTRQRIGVKYHIEPLNHKETSLYIHHRLNIAGADRRIFSKKGIKEIYNFSQGNPRMINIICDHSLLSGYSKGLKSINELVIRECAKELTVQNYFNKNEEDNLSFSHEKRIQKTNKTYKRQSWRNKVLTIAVLSRQEKDFIKSNLKTLVAVINQRNHKGFGKSREIIEKPYVIYFKENSIELLNWKLHNLDRIAKCYSINPKIKIYIEGYTDSFGNYWYNKKLTRYRAEMVKTLLIRKGVSPINIKVFGNEHQKLISRKEKLTGRIKSYSAVMEFGSASRSIARSK